MGAAILNQSRVQGHKTDNLPKELIRNARSTPRTAFNASKHLSYIPPSKISTFADIDQPSTGISDTAVSEPFLLFSPEAIQQMRAEAFSEEVLEHHYSPTSETGGMIRGHCPGRAPFIYDAWTSPELLKIVSEIAGVDLVPAMEYDIGHVNVSVSNDSADTSLETAAQDEVEDSKNSKRFKTPYDYHRDCFPFVVVTMLSDCTDMIGGETAIRTESGKVIMARGPSLGTAVVMQARYIDHKATVARGGKERISMITSFRPRDINMKDESDLSGVKIVSHIPTLYYQYSSYRLENLEARVREQCRLIRRRQRANADFDVKQLRSWVETQKAYLDTLLNEIQEV
ncbi:unnamed protein product [Zymoseptoria tritici ST99CH_3D1]|uniref:Fe2OG dioxygenase domain-containing protein n=3 Tax=Zymoseptoria tritici TaxID=1047171 RepID=F9X3D1_ZYMTI|nr:uncharacterized protein MYCGRDRAFT_35631 [Zymoseptoria tritici IPO323]EGP90739.1 hypothetical protein MYCGRDRAFT_35631 [Zymoseptoria tritici IPO323]SMQ47208.1 unnamed protein product [Zymoseptoria tritici ST99CH_3D7]SMR45734.1 unnamed protein product [Zymoseptoria tritici ST99CH_1E4]SMR46988.1 unnamed protein product [Zymoseptoria tritici ST99CH_3D1]